MPEDTERAPRTRLATAIAVSLMLSMASPVAGASGNEAKPTEAVGEDERKKKKREDDPEARSREKTAKIQDKTVFLVEPAEAGIFQIRNVPQADLEAVLATLCPNTLLPYAREAVASVVQRAGFPPVTLQHMNFEAIYQQRLQQLQAQQAGGSTPPAAPAH